MEKMRIGCALPFDILSDAPAKPATEALYRAFGHADALLDALGETAQTVELRAVSAKTAPETVLAAETLCHAHGLAVTVHGALCEDETPEHFFAPYRLLFRRSAQACYNITVHGLATASDTVQGLSRLIAYAEQNALPVHFTLENNRRKAYAPCCCDNTAAVAERIAEIHSPYLSACWDFGHYRYNKHTFPEFGADETALPPEAFLSVVGHTHIHGLSEAYQTHFPLEEMRLPLKAYLAALYAHGYSGIYSLELEFPRFYPQTDGRQALLSSLALLKTRLQALEKEATP